MTAPSEFRNSEQEIFKLLEECSELRRALKSISSQLGRIETRVKRAFPLAAKQIEERKRARARTTQTSLTSEQALVEFDRVVGIASSGHVEEAERALREMAPPDLLVMAKELGVSFPKSKPSARVLMNAIIGRVRESLLLASHNRRS